MRRAAWLLTIPVVLVGCRRTEPPKPAPADWKVWYQDSVTFSFPPGWKLLLQDRKAASLRVLVSTGDTPERLVLCLEFGEGLQCPVLNAFKGTRSNPLETRIAGFDAQRYGPGQDAAGVCSEGLLDLGGRGRFTWAHFYYSNLDPRQQDLAETVIASIRKQS